MCYAKDLGHVGLYLWIMWGVNSGCISRNTGKLIKDSIVERMKIKMKWKHEKELGFCLSLEGLQQHYRE